MPPPSPLIIVSETLDAPAATEALQIGTLGRRYTSANAPVFGTVVIPRPGRAGVHFSVFADAPQAQADASLSGNGNRCWPKPCAGWRAAWSDRA